MDKIYYLYMDESATCLNVHQRLRDQGLYIVKVRERGGVLPVLRGPDGVFRGAESILAYYRPLHHNISEEQDGKSPWWKYYILQHTPLMKLGPCGNYHWRWDALCFCRVSEYSGDPPLRNVDLEE